MKAISHGNIKRFLVAASVALAVPLTAVAFQGHPGGHHGCGDFAMQGGPGMGGEMMPPHLRGLNLTEAQRDKIFEIMHAQAPVMRDKAKALRKAEEDLRALTAAADYSDAKAKSLADAGAWSRRRAARHGRRRPHVPSGTLTATLSRLSPPCRCR